MHDENSEKKFFTIISKEVANQENDRNSTVDALNKTIFKVNHLKETIQKFVEAAKYELRSKSFISDINKEISRIIKQASFVSIYSEMYDLFRQKEKHFP